jgi:hypothetical protein
MPVGNPGPDGAFAITLPAGATPEQLAMRARFIPLIPPLVFKRGIPGYETLLPRLHTIAVSAFDGLAGNPPDPQGAMVELGEFIAEIKRLDARPGRFVVELPDRNDPATGRDIDFSVTPAPAPVPPDQLELKADIEDTLTTLQVIFPEQPGMLATVPPPGRFDQYRVKLYSLAQVGLQGDAEPKAGRQALVALHNEILRREGPRVKNGYMKMLGLSAIIFGGSAFVIYLILRNNPGFSVQLVAFKNFFLLWAGTMVGAWLSFGIRRPILTVSDLGNLEADMVEPPIRLIFTGLIVAVIAFVFLGGMVNIVIGGLKSSDLLLHGSTALLIGMLLGVSEQALPGALTKRASQFVSEFAGR